MNRGAAARLLAWARARVRAGDAIGLLTLAGAFALKRAYSTAGADDLAWVLTPSAWLASHWGGIELVPESGAGWISHHTRMVVGPACAGVNFLVVAWLALYFTCQANLRGWRDKLAWLFASLAFAYAATLATNGLRIVLAAHLYGADFGVAWLTKERLHRLLGIVLYCSALLALCHTAARCLHQGVAARSLRAHVAPFYWYVGVVIGVPLANRAFLRDPARFLEHATLTLSAGLGVVLFWRLSGLLVDRLQSRRVS